jgi:SAM-dependent methyltransferase
MTKETLEHRVVDDPVLGYRHLDPLPDGADLDRFYQSAYIDMIRRGERFPELARLLASGSEAEDERSWIRSTLHADILAALDSLRPPESPRLLVDIGSGIGEFVASATAEGWTAIGLEPSREAADSATARGRTVLCATLEEYLAAGGPADQPAAVVLLNVVEHLLDPTSLLRSARQMLTAGGALVIRVPNDFNPLQEMARSALGHLPWWIASPDHVNYFDHASLRKLVESVGFEVADQWGDFPMELFLLMGDDYVAEPALGPKCHARRQRLELAMDVDARRAFGRSLVALGWGRNTVIVAIAKPQP